MTNSLTQVFKIVSDAINNTTDFTVYEKKNTKTLVLGDEEDNFWTVTVRHQEAYGS